MHRLLRWTGRGLAGLVVGGALAVWAFDLWVVRPQVARIQRVLVEAAPSEREPPAALRDMLHRAYGDRIGGLLARNATFDAMRNGERMHPLRRMFTEAGIAKLLPHHLSDSQLESAYLASAYMGEGIHGFSAASERHLGIALARVDQRQAARLVALSFAPASYLHSPRRLEQRVQVLLSGARADP